MRILTYLVTFCIVLNCLPVLGQQPFTAGNIVLYRVGDGTTALNDDYFKVYLDEYTPAGALVQTIEMPSTGPKKINNIGRSPATSLLSLSANGKYLVVPGFNEPLGAFNDMNRSIGLVDFNGGGNVSAFWKHHWEKMGGG